ncbi:MAG: TRAP transporter substrate-binding protein DctP [Pseudorhodobacter sp.]
MNLVAHGTIKALIGTMFIVGPAFSETLTLAHGYAPSHSLVTEWMEPWMRCVTENTDGEVDFSHFPSGQIVTVPTALSSLNSGLTDVTVIAIGSNSDRFPLNGITMLPGMGESASHMVRAYRVMLGQEGAFQDEFVQNEVYPVSVNMTPVYQLMWRDGPVEDRDAISGKLVRSLDGPMSFALDAINAVPVSMPPSDMYLALEQGAIDGVLLSPISVPPYHLNEVLSAITENMSFGSSAAVLSISEAAMDRMDEPLRQQILDCGRQIEIKFAMYFDQQNDELLKEFAAEGIDVYRISHDELNAINEQVQAVHQQFTDRLENQGHPAMEVLNTYRQVIAAESNN